MGKKIIRNKQRQRIEERKSFDTSRRNEINPFELKRNKIKHQVLGRRIGKNEIGKPLVNRGRAYKKRADTLLGEYQNRFKGGKGVRDMRSSNAEERITTKYKESQNEVDFNEGQPIFLTHKGKPLDDVINERPESDDEELDLFNRDGFIERTHFGGGDDGLPRSSKDVLNDIMLEKQEKKAEKQEMAHLTDRLDSQWQQVQNLLRHKGQKEEIGQTTVDDYDKFMAQLVTDDSTKPKSEVKPLPQSPQKAANLPAGATSTTDSQQQQSPDQLLKAKLKEIDSSKRLDEVLQHLRDAICLLQNGNKKTFQLVKDRIVELAKSKLKFTPKEMSTIYLAVYFQELKVIAHLLIVKTLNRLRYTNFHEIAISIFLNNFLLDSIKKGTVYPEVFVHIHNLVRLGLNQEKVRLMMFNRFQYDGETLLNVVKYQNPTMITENSSYRVNLNSLFNSIFSAQDKIDKREMSFTLLLQAVKLCTVLHDKFKNDPKIIVLLEPIKRDLETIRNVSEVPERLKQTINELLNKVEETPVPVIVNPTRPKPFILPMLEPKFDESRGKKSRGLDDTKNLAKKVRRETKGAQREIRKDSTFLRNVFLDEQQKKDRTRQKKVKDILRDLSVQQGLYKKAK